MLNNMVVMFQPQVHLRLPCYDFTSVIHLDLTTQIGLLRSNWTPMVWRAVCTRSENVFTVACWSTITSDSYFMYSSCRVQSELRQVLMRLAPPCGIATLCTCHCSTCVAQPIRAMMTCCDPHLPPTYIGSIHREPLIVWFRQLWMRVMLVMGLNHTSHDTSWQQPCSTCSWSFNGHLAIELASCFQDV